MLFAHSTLLVASSLLVFLAGVAHGGDTKSPRTDSYGDPLPPGAVARLGTVWLRHADSLFTFSADGKQLISFDADGEVRFWDVTAGKLIRSKWLWRTKQELWHDPYPIRDWDILRYSIALAPNGAAAAARRNGAICLYDIAAGEIRRRLPINNPDPNEFLKCTFSRDGKLLTVVRKPDEKPELTLQSWEVTTGKMCHSFKLSIPHLRLGPYSSDGKRLAGAIEDDEDHVWDTSTGKELGRFKTSPTSRPVFSPDNKILVAALDGLKILIWDTTTHRKIAVLAVSEDEGADCSFRSIVFSPDSRFIAGVYDNSGGNKPKEGIVIWDVKERREVRRLQERRVLWLALAPEGKTLASAGWDDEIRLWDVASGRQLHLRPGPCSPVRSLAVTPDGRSLVSGGTNVRLWDTATSKQLRVFENVGGEVLISPDGKRVIAASKPSSTEERFIVWDAATGKELRRIVLTWPPNASYNFSNVKILGLSADGKRLTAAGWDYFTKANQVYHWEIDTGRLLSKRSYPDKKNLSPVAVSSDGELVCLYRESKVRIEEARTGRLLSTLPQTVGGVAVFSPDGRIVATTNRLPRKGPLEGFDWSGLSLIETATGKEVLLLQTPKTHSFAFTTDGRGLVAVDEKALRVWDVATGKRLHQMAWPASIIERQSEYDPAVYSLALLPGGRAATGMRDGTILTWDLAAKSWPSNGLARELTSSDLKNLWADLAGEAAVAHRAVHNLAASPAAALPFLNAQLVPEAVAESKRIARLLADLDSDAFPEREAATRELIQLREWMEPILCRMLEDKPNAEVRRRLHAILNAPAPAPPISVERQRLLRALAVLEYTPTPEARCMMAKLARGPTSPVTQAAQAALRRLKHRTVSAKEGSAS